MGGPVDEWVVECPGGTMDQEIVRGKTCLQFLRCHELVPIMPAAHVDVKKNSKSHFVWPAQKATSLSSKPPKKDFEKTLFWSGCFESDSRAPRHLKTASKRLAAQRHVNVKHQTCVNDSQRRDLKELVSESAWRGHTTQCLHLRCKRLNATNAFVCVD